MHVSNPFLLNLIVISTLLFPVAGAYLVAYLLRERYPNHVYTLWLGFAISFVITFPLCALANHHGWVSNAEGFVGDAGKNVKRTLDFMFGIGEEILLLAAAIFVMFLAQAIAYLLSWPIGCASSIGMVSRTIGIGTLLIVKSIISAGGFLLGLVLNCWFYGWNLGPTQYLLALSFSMVMVSFGMLYAYLDMPHNMRRLNRKLMVKTPGFYQVLARIHKQASRNVKPAAYGDSDQELADIAARMAVVLQKSAAERAASKDDMRELLDLTRATAKFDAETSAPGSNRVPTPQESNATDVDRKRIDELEKKSWNCNSPAD